MRYALGLIALFFSACAAPSRLPVDAPVDQSAQTRAISSSALFGPPRPYAAARSNAQITQDILELGFRLESGREIAQFSRFEGPVTLSLRGPVPPLAAVETDRLIARLRSEAGIDIRRVSGAAQIHVEFVPRATLRRSVPEAACFVLPNVDSWADFRAAPRGQHLDWARVARREKALVIAPSDATVQEMRDCLHEEISQALGPLNDLYRIGETVWNDDNFQTVLTGFDMLVLRTWYHPDLQSGMSRADVAARLPDILRRLNPRGQRAVVPLDPIPTPQSWNDTVEAALGTSNRRQSFRLAQDALATALEQGWRDERMALSLFLAARFAPPRQGEEALQALVQAAAIYASRPGGDVPRAHVELHLAAQALAAGRHDLVLRLTDAAIPPARRSENGALLASLMWMRAQSLHATNETAMAERLTRDAMGYAVFGFGSLKAAETRRQEIAALTTLRNN